jgi:23S rRNA (adenine2503-C2)-methyltransferase
MLAGVNDSPDDARALVEWLAELRVHVNLIPYNAIDDAPHLAASDRPTREAFGAVLKSAGLKTTIRYSLGADVAAACGQLVRKENRAFALASPVALHR